ncbi:MAG: helix-turn-helix domain-containing protein [Sphingobacteriales bacterium]
MRFEKTFGETIKKLREEKKLPLRQVAGALEIDTSMLGKIEKNSRKPTRSFIEKISKYFNVSDRNLIIAFLSDEVAYQIMNEESYAHEVLKVAEEKVEYLRTQKNS